MAEPRLENWRSLFFECKNDIGTLGTYHRAPEALRSAAEIAGKVLGFLKAAAEKQDKRAVISMVVTMPASFQAGQRLDTVRAAKPNLSKLFRRELTLSILHYGDSSVSKSTVTSDSISNVCIGPDDTLNFL